MKHKYYSFGIFVIIVAIVVYILLTTSAKRSTDIENEVNTEQTVIQKKQQAIDSLNVEIEKLQIESSRDSVIIQNLLDGIKQDGVKLVQKRKEVAKLKPNEKADWLIDRYSNK